MKTKMKIMMLVLALAVGMQVGTAQAGEVYGDPGWSYVYEGDQAAADLDGTWDHDNGSDAWDASAIGSGLPGGISALTESDIKFVRIQDAVTSDPGFDPSNRKIGLTHQLTQDISQAESDVILSGPGVTLSFRARIATGSPLDDIDGSPWPAGGDGYIIHDGAKDNFAIHQDSYGGDAGINLSIAFALALASDDASLSSDGLTMNSANGDVPSADVDTGEGATQNFLPLSNITDWHEFWITIEPDIVVGSHTNKVKIWVDGNSDPLNPDGTFNVTVGNGEDEGYDYIAMGCGATGQSGAIDVDFFAYKPGLHDPIGGAKLRPKADAGPDQVIIWPDDDVTLAASVQDDGDPNHVLKYWWEVTGQPAGSSINLTNPTGLGPFTINIPGHVDPNKPYAVTPTVTVSQSGIYELRLNARDEKSDSNDTVRIFVYPVGYDGLVAHWKLDDGIDTGPTTLTAVDSAGSYVPNFSSNNFDHIFHPGALNGETDPGEPNWVDGINWTDTPLLIEPEDFIGGLRFDGIDDFIEVPHNSALGLTKNYTITAWIKPNLQAGAMGIVTKVTGSNDKQYAFTINGSGNLGLEYEASGNNYAYWGAALSDDVWQHVAVTVDDDLGITLYINSVPAGSATAPAEVQALAEPVCIGRWAGSYNFNYFDGIIDDVRMYNEAKTQEEIRQIAGISNAPPTADAGSDQRLIKETEGDSITLTEADVKDLPGNYTATWSLLSGPGPVTFSPDENTVQVTVQFDGSSFGLYHLQLYAVDGIEPTWDSTNDMYIMYQAKAQYSTDRNDPMGMWKLDESGADPDAIDSSGNGFHGPRATTDTLDPNLPEWQPGQGKVPGGNQGALKFLNVGDDQDQYVDLSLVPGTDNMTLTFWAKPNVLDHMQVMDKLPYTTPAGNAGWSARLRNDGSVMFRVGDDNANYDNFNVANAYNANEWVHVAITFDNSTGTATVYVNGLQGTQGTTTHTINTIYPPVQMGFPHATDFDDEYQGLLDHIRYYDIVLTPLEIALIAVEDSLEIDGCQLSIPGTQMTGDLDGNCYVDVRDLKIMLASWLICKDLNNPTCWP